MKPKILALAGSLRRGSYNRMMIRIAAEAAKRADADVTLVELAEYPLPPYDGDIEEQEGIPKNAKKLKELFIGHQGLLIASPEYNSSISGTFKNVIDWISRPEPNEAFLVAFQNKVAGIMSASMGELGGLRGLVHLRSMLGNINVLVLPDQVTISTAHEAFDSLGNLKDGRKREKIEQLSKKLVKTVDALNAVASLTS